MKKLILLGITVSALLLSNCSNEEVMQGQDTLKNVELSATVNESASRAAIDDKGGFSWTEEDQIYVHTSASDPNPVWQTFTLQSAPGSLSGTFSGAVLAGSEITSCAVHPTALNPVLNGNELALTLPSSYNFKEGITNVVMMAYINDNLSVLKFNHLGGLFRITMTDIPEGVAKFVFIATGKKLAGEFKVSDITAEKPQITTADDASNTNNSVTINFAPASAVKDRIFYIPVPTGQYGALKCELRDVDNKLVVTTDIASSENVARRDFIRKSYSYKSMEGGVAVHTSDDLNTALSKVTQSESTTVIVGGELSQSLSAPISIPLSNPQPSAATPKATLAFGAIPKSGTEGGVIEINDGTSEISAAATSRGIIELAIPQLSATEEAPSINMNIPTGTGVLSAVNSTATYGTVTVLASDNTLIVNKGVTVQKLIIKGGSVKIFGVVGELSIEAASTTKKVLVYPGASCTQFTDNRSNEENKITPSYVPGDSGENEGYTGGDVTHEWD